MIKSLVEIHFSEDFLYLQVYLHFLFVFYTSFGIMFWMMIIIKGVCYDESI